MSIARTNSLLSVTDPAKYRADRRRGMGETEAEVQYLARLRQRMSTAKRTGNSAAYRKARREYDSYRAAKAANAAQSEGKEGTEMVATKAARTGAQREEAKVEAAATQMELRREHDPREARGLAEAEKLLSQALALVRALRAADLRENAAHAAVETLILDHWPAQTPAAATQMA